MDINDVSLKIYDFCRILINSISGGVQIAQILYNDRREPIDYLYLDANSVFAEITGLAKEEIIGRKATDFHPDIGPEWFIKYGEIVETGKSENFETWSVTTGCWYNILVVPLGAQDIFAIISTDITERKEMEEELRKSKSKLKELHDSLEEKVAERTEELAVERKRLFDVLETLPAKIFLLSSDYKVRFANRAYWKRYGEPNDRCCYDFIFGLDKPCEQCETLRPLATGQPHNWIFTAPDGSISDVYNFPFTDVDGKLMILDMNVDITDKKKIEREMARLDRLNLIGQMAVGIGHEIRNPMTTVRGFLQMLGEKPEYANDLEIFGLMIEELDRANGIISEFLGLARDKMVDLQPRSLDKVIKSLLPMIMSDANLWGIDVKLELNSPLEVRFDENEMRQLILNMSRNAVEAMSSHGVLTIGTRQEGDEVVLYIRDEGSGLSPKIIDKIGTPFYTTKENGTGLGLAICYSIAARHNARIDYETGPEGTTFFVRFQPAGK